MDFDYGNLRKMAKEKENENLRFRNFLKMYDGMTDEELDSLVFKITEKVCSRIDCTQCGRCCVDLQPMLTDKDQKRLANKLQIDIEGLRKEYLEYDNSDPDEPDWIVKSTPCPFLSDKKCTVYESRPDNCRDYPYLYEPDFSFRTMGMIGRTFTCPIVFEVLEELKKQLDFSEDFMDDLETW